MKVAALIQKGFHRDSTIITAEKVLEMATIDGARAVGLEKEIGSIEPGKKADIIVLDFNNASMTPIHHPVSAIVCARREWRVNTRCACERQAGLASTWWKAARCCRGPVTSS